MTDKTESTDETSGRLQELIDLVARLRGDRGCPWDRKQTHETLRTYLVEEMFELIDAIDSGSPDSICEELGDVLFQLVFLAQLSDEKGQFDMRGVIHRNARKMIRRHPHVFGDAHVSGTSEVRRRWGEIKKTEKPRSRDASILDSVPAKLPALMRAYRISERAAGAGFDWEDIHGVLGKVDEELGEFKEALSNGGSSDADHTSMMLEFGDILFTLVNVARFAAIHPETALAGSTRKFEKRFRRMERKAAEKRKPIDAVPRDELESFWKEAKNETT